MIDQCDIEGGNIWSPQGGQLEYVGQKIVHRNVDGNSVATMVLYFTCHDDIAVGEPSISKEFYAHYKLEVELARDYGQG